MRVAPVPVPLKMECENQSVSVVSFTVVAIVGSSHWDGSLIETVETMNMGIGTMVLGTVYGTSVSCAPTGSLEKPQALLNKATEAALSLARRPSSTSVRPPQELSASSDVLTDVIFVLFGAPCSTQILCLGQQGFGVSRQMSVCLTH